MSKSIVAFSLILSFLMNSYLCLNSSFAGMDFSNAATIFNGSETYCNFLKTVAPYCERVLDHLAMLPLALVMLLSLFNKKYHDIFKWILFYQSLMILLTWIDYDIYLYVNPSNIVSIVVLRLSPFITQFGFTSFGVLAINRFCRLYFPKFFSKMFSKPINLIIFLIPYNFIVTVIVISYRYIFILDNRIIISFTTFYSLMPIVLSLFIFVKIHNMKKIALNSNDAKSLTDIQRAAIICFLQPIFFLIYFVVVFTDIFVRIYMLSVGDISKFSPFLVNIILTADSFQNSLYAITNIADALLILFGLKTYRMRFVGFFSRNATTRGSTISRTAPVITGARVGPNMGKF